MNAPIDRRSASPAVARQRLLGWAAVLAVVGLLHAALLGGATMALARTASEPVRSGAAAVTVVVARAELGPRPSAQVTAQVTAETTAETTAQTTAEAPPVATPAMPATPKAPTTRSIAAPASAKPRNPPRPAAPRARAAAAADEARSSFEPAVAVASAETEPPQFVPVVMALPAKGGDPEPAAAAAPAVEAPASAAASAAASGATAASAAPTRLPTYRTRIPGAALVNYRLSRGGIYGSGELEWKPEGNGYTARLEGRVPIIGTLITQISRGRFDAAGLAPERFTDKRMRRNETAANFQRGDGVISFSGQQPEVPITPGVQDRVSVMVQLAAIAAGWSRPPPAGEPYLIRVVGARGDAQVWTVRFEGPQNLRTPEGLVAALHFQRDSKEPNDTRAEFWLDPARQFLPVRVLLADGNGEALELMRQP